MDVLSWLREFYAGSEPVEFESAFPIDESVERLRAATRRSISWLMSEQQAVGPVAASHVSLERVIPMVRNSFKPLFQGRFVERGGKVFLAGSFTLHAAVKIFMTVWFAGVVFGCLVVGAGLVSGQAAPQPALFIPFAMLLFGVVLVGLGRWLARKDAEWLAQVIRNALQPPQTGLRRAAADHPEPPEITILLAAASLVMAGLAVWFAPTFVVSFVRALPVGTGHGPLGPLWTALRSPMFLIPYGALLLVTAWGVYRRRLVAWRAFFLFQLQAPVYQIAFVWFGDAAPLPVVLKCGISVMFCAVTAMWLKWWYDQRMHFMRG